MDRISVARRYTEVTQRLLDIINIGVMNRGTNNVSSLFDEVQIEPWDFQPSEAYGLDSFWLTVWPSREDGFETLGQSPTWLNGIT
ncbi:Uncharacterized protein HZ326_30680 [Fusarium oxysporum f. sp. albedinis]|nr:Uncharacterized protein HZ326_30680 [Fusarium oxysporum f. sp. albedinis]